MKTKKPKLSIKLKPMKKGVHNELKKFKTYNKSYPTGFYKLYGENDDVFFDMRIFLRLLNLICSDGGVPCFNLKFHDKVVEYSGEIGIGCDRSMVDLLKTCRTRNRGLTVFSENTLRFVPSVLHLLDKKIKEPQQEFTHIRFSDSSLLAHKSKVLANKLIIEYKVSGLNELRQAKKESVKRLAEKKKYIIATFGIPKKHEATDAYFGDETKVPIEQGDRTYSDREVKNYIKYLRNLFKRKKKLDEMVHFWKTLIE